MEAKQRPFVGSHDASWPVVVHDLSVPHWETPSPPSNPVGLNREVSSSACVIGIAGRQRLAPRSFSLLSPTPT
jgi:hypothetical protein